MNAQELRIGNWVYSLDIQQNDRIAAGGIQHVEHYPDRWLPIPLTPEILEKCGFTNVFNEYWMNKNIIDVRIKDLAIDIGIEENEERKHLTHIKYLHQLQNLYFALTGEELEVNL